MKQSEFCSHPLISSSGIIYSQAGICRLICEILKSGKKCVDDPVRECKEYKTATGDSLTDEKQISGTDPA